MYMEKVCPECGYPLEGRETICPECGHTLSQTSATTFNDDNDKSSTTTSNSDTSSADTFNNDKLFADCSIESVLKLDLGQYIYESFLIAKYSFWKKFWCFKGRATRREF